MRYYPVNLDIRKRNCLVVGGGAVGTRKVRTLRACRARVTVVSPDATDTLRRLAQKGDIRLMLREYREADLTGMFLVIGATDDELLNRRIHADAEKRGMLCNIADRPAACNFILPAVVHRGDLVIAVSTSGKSPAFAKKLRKQLETEYGEEYATLLTLMGALREKLLKERHEPEAHKPLFERLLSGNILGWIRNGETGRIDRLLYEVLGPEYNFDSLVHGENQDMP